nr:transketolase C-terminal domain-containing protein [bacterium]
IRLYCAGMNLPITVVGVGAGFSYDDSGPTHHTLEDISFMRVLPNLRVYNMTDSVMARAFAAITRGQDHSSYIRLDRQVLPTLYAPGDDFSSGMRRFRSGSDLLLVATGNMVHCALKLAEELESKGVAAGVLDVYRFPIDPDLLGREVGEAPRVATLAEHTLPGGLGSAVLETLETAGIVMPVKRLGLDLSQGYCYQYGGRENIQRLHDLDHPTNLETILSWVGE